MKVLLIFPPQCEPYMPYLSIAWLGTFLKSKGVQVVQRDLNIEVYHLLLSEAFLKESLGRARAALSDLEAREALPEDELARYHFLTKVTASGEYVIAHVNDAKSVYTSEKFYDPVALLHSHKLINDALRLALAPWYPTFFSLSAFNTPSWSIFKSSEILAAVHSDQQNAFREIFSRHYLASILAEKPDVVGISIDIWGQILPGLTLASLIKEAAADVHVCIGGQVPSRWEEALPGLDREFFDLFDSAIVREGEIPLLRLTAALQEGQDLTEVPNLIYWDDDQVKVNPIAEMVDINAIPTPSFDGFPLDAYFLPELVLPLYTQRGCYWGKCAFCDHYYGFENYYVARDLALVVEDIRQLGDKYQTRLFSFSDENTPPQRLKELSERLLAANLDVKWLLPLRFEQEYTPDTCALLHRAGCTLVMWGMESACQRVLDAMNKGTNVQVNGRVLENFAGAGVWNHVAIVLGFPSEEREEAEETIQYLVGHTDLINGVFDNVFMLVPWSVVAHEPERFGVIKAQDDAQDLALFHIHYPLMGMSFEDTKSMHAAMLERLRQAYPNFEFWNTLTWFHTFLYLLKRGRNEVSTMHLAVEPKPHAETDWEKAVVRLREGVFPVVRAFDSSRTLAGLARRGQYPGLYDLDGDRFFSTSQGAQQLLDQCRQGLSLAEIVSQLSDATETPVEKVAKTCQDFLTRLSEEELVIVE